MSTKKKTRKRYVVFPGALVEYAHLIDAESPQQAAQAYIDEGCVEAFETINVFAVSMCSKFNVGLKLVPQK